MAEGPEPLAAGSSELPNCQLQAIPPSRANPEPPMARSVEVEKLGPSLRWATATPASITKSSDR